MIFCSFPEAEIEERLRLRPVGSFIEEEGVTLVIPKATAEQHGIPFSTVWKAITLGVHSSLEAVGLTAAIATRLARHGISANIVAAFYHDHIFVAATDAENALQALRSLQAEAAAAHGAA
jgi:hypothetical protein